MTWNVVIHGDPNLVMYPAKIGTASAGIVQEYTASGARWDVSTQFQIVRIIML